METLLINELNTNSMVGIKLLIEYAVALAGALLLGCLALCVCGLLAECLASLRANSKPKPARNAHGLLT
ncbi:MAG: hypothetical protein HOP19_21265 [Acidobacteria bacterium]|nr:hypothetical protein [Acidobacteriota bacterium]